MKILCLAVLATVYAVLSGIVRQRKKAMQAFLTFLYRLESLCRENSPISDAVEEALTDNQTAFVYVSFLFGEVLLDPSFFHKRSLQRFLYGGIPEGVRLFQAGMEVLQEEGYSAAHRELFETARIRIEEEILCEEQRRIGYSGCFFMILLPLWTVPFLKTWAIHVAAEMEAYYTGAYHALCGFALFLLCGLLALVFFRCRFYGCLPQKSEGSLTLLPGIFSDLYCRILFRFPRYASKLACLLKQEGRGGTLAGVHGRAAVCMLLFAAGFYLTGLDFFGKWQGGFMAVAGALIGMFFPRMLVLFHIAESGEEKKRECIRLMHMVRLLTVDGWIAGEDLTERVTGVAVYCKQPLEDMLFALERGEDLAARKPAFLAEGLTAANDLGVVKGFASLPSLCRFEETKYWEEEKRRESDRMMMVRFCAFLPVGLMVVLYLILPFVLEGLGRMAAYGEGFGYLM